MRQIHEYNNMPFNLDFLLCTCLENIIVKKHYWIDRLKQLVCQVYQKLINIGKNVR